MLDPSNMMLVSLCLSVVRVSLDFKRMWKPILRASALLDNFKTRWLLAEWVMTSFTWLFPRTRIRENKARG
jgi:hypothetical protein